jgi:hypothetical protein
MENGKWKMKEVFPFSIFRFPFSVDKARASAFLILLVQSPVNLIYPIKI